MTLRTLGRLAIERYFGRRSRQAACWRRLGTASRSDMGGGYEWQAAPAYRASVRRGISAIALDQQGKITRLTTVCDGAMIPDADIKALIVLSLE